MFRGGAGLAGARTLTAREGKGLPGTPPAAGSTYHQAQYHIRFLALSSCALGKRKQSTHNVDARCPCASLPLLCSTYGTHLRHLQGVGDYITPDTIHHLAHLTLLQSLDLSTERHALQLPPRSLQAIASCRHLTSLRLGNHLTCWETFELAAELPALQQLEFSYTREVDVSVQEFAPLKHSRTIQRLAISGMPCSDQLLDVLAASPVTDLSIHAGAFCATPKGAALMAGRLQKLQLLVNDRDNAAFTAALPVLGSSLSSLSLSLHKASADCRPLLKAVFSLPALQHLSLGSQYNGLTEWELQDLPVLTHCTNLSLSNHFTDATLCATLRSTPHLRQLQLGSSGEVGSLGLGCVLGHCRGLREVRLVLMRGVTAAGVAALASGPCVSRVVLEGCRNVSAEECRELMRLLNKPDLDIIKLR